MKVGDVDVGLLDQLKDDDIDAAVRMKILSFIQGSKFKVFRICQVKFLVE